MLAKAAILALALLAAGCTVTARDDWQTVNRQTEIIAAQTRRAQIIAELEHLERLQRRTVTIDARAVIASNINRLRFELEQLNMIVNQ